jgi:hypothetical protein
MSDSGDAALSLIEALIEHLEAQGALTPENISAIYDDALLRVQADPHFRADEVSELQARLARRNRQ